MLIAQEESCSNDRKVSVMVVYGPSGIGKTHNVKASLDNNMYEPVRSKQGLYFDGYNQQSTLVLDNFDRSIDFEMLMRLTGHGKLQVETKRGTVYACWDRVIIIAEKHPDT